MRPLTNYYGGKQKLSAKLVDIVEAIRHRVYTEPFCGGAAVLFARNNPAAIEVLNDHDCRIVNLYRVAKQQPQKLVALINATPYAESELRRAKIVLGDESKSELQRAWACWIALQMGFSAVIGGGWKRGRIKNEARRFANTVCQLESVISRLAGVQITNCDATKTIEHYDGADSLHYCDPPYPDANQGHYGGYTLEDYKRLIDCLASCSGSVVLSNYAKPVAMPKGFRLVEIATVTSAGKAAVGSSRPARVEQVWICDRS